MLIRALYGVLQSSVIKEAALLRSLAPANDETQEEKALQTQEDLINYILVPGMTVLPLVNTLMIPT